MLTMLNLMLLAFLSVPFHQRIFQVNNADVVFNDYLNDVEYYKTIYNLYNEQNKKNEIVDDIKHSQVRKYIINLL